MARYDGRPAWGDDESCHIVPKELPDDLSERIVQKVTAAPAGLGKGELVAAFGKISSARTIARRLSELVASGRLTTIGRARALRYVAAPIRATANIVEQPDQIIAEAEDYVPISAESRKLLEHIRKPVAQRRPVGYRREFLDRYVPNRTRYLPAALRKRLMAMGEPYRDQRPAGTYARDILNRLLIDLSWASNRLEGNTYTRLETQRLIEFGAAAEGKDQREAQMILNHKAAIEMLVENVDEIGFNMYTFKNLHANLSENLLADPMAS